MSVTVSASLAGASVPRVVQIVVGGLTAGAPVTVTGHGGGATWTVRGADGVPAPGAQMILGDVATPINTPVTYEVAHGGSVVTSAPVTVTAPGRVAVQLLDGSMAAVLGDRSWQWNRVPWESSPRGELFDVPGRVTPVVRWDVSGTRVGELRLWTWGADSVALGAVLDTGAPLVVRSDGQVRDFPAVVVMLAGRVSSFLTGAREGGYDIREWTIPFREVGVPSGGGPVAVASWTDFDAFWATPGPTRTNRNTNPSFETNVSGYDPPFNATISRGTVAGFAVMGTAYMNIAASGASVAEVRHSLAAVSGDVGRTLGFGLSLRRVSGPTHARLLIDGPGTTAPRVTPWTAIPTTGHLRLVAANLISSAAQVTTQVQLAGNASGGTPSAGNVRVDAWHLETAGSVAEAELRARHPWDGSTSGASWSGTAHASTSTRTQQWWVDFDAMWLGGEWSDLDRSDWVA